MHGTQKAHVPHRYGDDGQSRFGVAMTVAERCQPAR